MFIKLIILKTIQIRYYSLLEIFYKKEEKDLMNNNNPNPPKLLNHRGR